MRYKEILPKLVVVLFGLTLYLWGVYENSTPMWDCGLDDSSYPAQLEALRIGHLFSFVLLITNVCFVLYLKAEHPPAAFQIALAIFTNGLIAFNYTREIMPSFERIILWIPHFIVGEVFGETSPVSIHSQVNRRLSFLSISTILIFGFTLLNRNMVIPYLHRFAARKMLSNK